MGAVASEDVMVRGRRPGDLNGPQRVASALAEAAATISQWPDYKATEVFELGSLASSLGVASVLVKAEANRFGLGSFKPLGPAFALARIARRTLAARGTEQVDETALLSGAYSRHLTGLTVACASSGNHGRALAWMASKVGVRCVVFLPETVSPQRAAAIARYGAEIVRITGTFDDAVEACRTSGLIVVSNETYPAHPDIPREIMYGYSVIGREIAEAGLEPTHVFVAGGGGRLAAGVTLGLEAGGSNARVVVVEPERSCAIAASMAEGRRITIRHGATMMDGLAVATPNPFAWPVLQEGVFAFMQVTEIEATGAIHEALGSSGCIEIGESGIAGLAGLLAAAREHRDAFEIDRSSRLLAIACEGVTDPITWRAVTGRAPERAWI